jgi:hypothetical protein
MQVYKITNIVNGKIYIGKDTLSNRNYMGSGVLIKRAIKKYGVDSFKKEILHETEDYNDLSNSEKYWIEFYKSNNRDIGYNISNGGDGGDTISNNPKLVEIKSKISRSMIGRDFSQDHREKLSKNHDSTKRKKGKSFEEIYGIEKSEKIKDNLKKARAKYKNEKERFGEKYGEIIKGYRERFLGDNNPMRKNKYKWYYNPDLLINKRIPDNEIIPPGFIPGRCKKSQ